MKALTGLPTQAYVRVGEEAHVPLKDLLTLVKELESNASPAFLARYRPDVAAGLDQRQIQRVRERLQEFVDLSDRRVMVLTALNQQGRLTPELRQEIEEALDRRELDDIYAPYRPKPRSAADEAVEHGLDELARYLWTQQPADSDPLVEAARFVQSDNGVGDVSRALEGARQIVARWLAENREVRRDLRQMVRTHALVVVHEVPLKRKLSAKDEAARKRVAGLFGQTVKAAKIPWRQVMQLRRGAREGWLRYAVEMPENEAVEYLLSRLLQQPDSEFGLQLSAACRTAFERYLAVQLEADVRQEMEDRCDREAVEHYCGNLRKILMTAPAGSRSVIGIETGRPGGWRAAVVGADGQLLEAAVVHMDRRDREAAEKAARRAAEADQDSGQESTQEAKAEDSEGPSEKIDAAPAGDDTAPETQAAAPDQASGEPDTQPAEQQTSAEAVAETAPTAQESAPQVAEVAAEPQASSDAPTEQAQAADTPSADTPSTDTPSTDTPSTDTPSADMPTEAVQAEAATSTDAQSEPVQAAELAEADTAAASESAPEQSDAAASAAPSSNEAAAEAAAEDQAVDASVTDRGATQALRGAEASAPDETPVACSCRRCGCR